MVHTIINILVFLCVLYLHIPGTAGAAAVCCSFVVVDVLVCELVGVCLTSFPTAPAPPPVNICMFGFLTPDLTHPTNPKRPTDMDKTELIFCPAEQSNGDDFLQFGACCTDMEEGVVSDKFMAAGPLTPECAVLYKEVRLKRNIRTS